MADPAKQAAHNPLSTTATQESYTGLGCFPLGKHVSPAEFSEVVKALHHLREIKMLHPLPAARLEEVKSQLQPLREAQAFWSSARDAHQAQAISEFLALLFPDAPPAEPHHLKIYIYPDSTLLSSSTPPIWGAFDYQLKTFARNTNLYISEKQKDLAGAILHTFMSSRRCPRLQCFLAEYVLADTAGRLTEDWELPQRFEEDISMLSDDELKSFLSRLEHESTLGAPILMAKLMSICESRLMDE